MPNIHSSCKSNILTVHYICFLNTNQSSILPLTIKQEALMLSWNLCCFIYIVLDHWVKSDISLYIWFFIHGRLFVVNTVRTHDMPWQSPTWIVPGWPWQLRQALIWMYAIKKWPFVFTWLCILDESRVCQYCHIWHAH